MELSAGAVIPVGAVPVYVNGKLGYNKTVTKTYKPVVEKCGQGEGSCFISQNVIDERKYEKYFVFFMVLFFILVRQKSKVGMQLTIP